MKPIYLGDKFYKYIEETDTVEIMRIIKMKNTETFIIENEETKQKYKISKEKLLAEFTRLKPDGYISFAIANLQDNLKDVIVALYRSKDLSEGEQLPYAACRQNIFDLFSNQIKKESNQNITYIGVSMSKDTVPENTPYELILACNGMTENTMVATYIDDTLDILLSMVRESKYDIVLQTLANNITDTNIQGSCTTLRQLLTENNFMHDFYKGFDIIKFPIEIEIIEETSELIPEQRIILEDYLKVEMFKTYIIEYDKEINLNKIERNHVLISDKNDKLYVLAYDKGEYINRTYHQNIKDKRDLLTMLKYKK